MSNHRKFGLAKNLDNSGSGSNSQLEIYTFSQRNNSIGKFRGVYQAILLYDGSSRKYCYKLYISTDKQMLGFEIDEKLPADYQTKDHLDYMFNLYDSLNKDSAPSQPITFGNMAAMVQKFYLN